MQPVSRFVLASVVVAAVAPVASASSLAAPSSGPRRVLVVPSGDERVDVAVRAGVVGPGVALVDVAATTGLLDDARAAGIVCEAGDAACWWRLTQLGGFDVALFVAGDVVTALTETAPVAATIARRDADAWSSATRRALGIAGEVRVRAQPPTSDVAIDGGAVVVVDGVAVGSVAPGTHRVVVAAPGFVESSSAVGVGAGAVVDVPVELVPVSSSASSSSSWLRDGGIGVLTVTAAVVGGLVAWGQVPYLACYGVNQPAGCTADGEITQTANQTAVAAVVVGVVGGLVGGAAVVAGGPAEPGGDVGR
jgi:hypothetical protein